MSYPSSQVTNRADSIPTSAQACLTEQEKLIALQEGWDIFEVTASGWQNNLQIIQRCDECGEAAGIADDDDAMALVTRKAFEGSPLHIKALRLHCTPVSDIFP